MFSLDCCFQLAKLFLNSYGSVRICTDLYGNVRTWSDTFLLLVLSCLIAVLNLQSQSCTCTDLYGSVRNCTEMYGTVRSGFDDFLLLILLCLASPYYALILVLQ